MSLSLAVLLCALEVAAPPPPENVNLDFASGKLSRWEGEGFTVAPAPGGGPRLGFGVVSADRDKPGRTGVLHRTFTVPARGGVLIATAFTSRPKGVESNANLDVVVFAAGKRIVPKTVRSGDGWKDAPRPGPRASGKPRLYQWSLDAYAGQTLRIALDDDDDRPDCFLYCSGFKLLTQDPLQTRDFARFMNKLSHEQKLPPVERFETKHFIALSNAGDEFTTMRMNNCELVYDLFYEHFRAKGFRVNESSSKLMAAIFDSQAGFESYVGQRLPPGVTGMYHPRTNRLVVYDFGTNSSFQAQKQAAKAGGQTIGSDLDRIRYIDGINRRAHEFRTGTNISTIMHEVAHQISFNCGLLNRDGDVPYWLAEGLACYCEATENGAWQGIGELNSERLQILAALNSPQYKQISMRDLVATDVWRENLNGNSALVGYAQSWALFQFLMEERTAQMRHYLATIYDRKTAATRLDDFSRSFGPDLDRLELRYVAFMKEKLEAWKPRR